MVGLGWVVWGVRWRGLCGRTYEEEPLGEEAVGGREVGCEGAHFGWVCVHGVVVCLLSSL